MLALESAAEKVAEDQPVGQTILVGPARDILEDFKELMKDESQAEMAAQLRRLLLDAPQTGSSSSAARFSGMLPEEVLGFWAIRDALPAPEELLSRDVGETSEEAQDRLVAAYILKKRLLPDDSYKTVKRGLQLRIDLAGHFAGLRKFAKLDALEQRWPELGQLVRADLSSLIDLETELLQPAGQAPAAPSTGTGRWQRYREDERLVRFLRLRPYFKDMYPKEVKSYVKAAQGVALSAEPFAKAAAPAEPPPAAMVPPAYKTLRFLIEAETPAGAYKVVLSYEGQQAAEAHAVLDWQEIRQAAEGLRRLRRLDEAPVARNLAYADVGMGLHELGAWLYDRFLLGDVRSRFERHLESGDSFRIFLDCKDPQFHSVPWECLYWQQRRVFLALDRKYSLIRILNPGVRPAPRPAVPSPLKLLILIPTPADLPPLNGDQEAEDLNRALEEAQQRNQVALHFLKGPAANRENLQRALRVFRPNMFHFIGHGHFDANQGTGRLMLQEGERSKPIEAPDLANLLRDQLDVAVLNGCDTGRGSSNDALSSVAAALVAAGVPAVVATMREIQDEAALRFTREFYRTFMDGYPLESAVIEARIALSAERWNWSAYALFSGVTTGLDGLRLLAPTARKA